MYDLVIHDGTIVTGEGLQKAGIGIRKGRIASILDPGEKPPAKEYVDATDRWVLPGAIDTHVHLRDPGHEEREDFTSGTAAAAAGGITMTLEMPLSVPAVNNGASLTARAEYVGRKALVDFALYGGAGFSNMDAMGELAEAGAVGMKTFLHAPHPGREDEFSGLWCTDEDELRTLMEKVAATGLRHYFHCEDDGLIGHHMQRMQATGRTDGLAHSEGRPESVEVASVATVLDIAEEMNAKIQIVHVSSPRSLALIHDARERGLDVTVETCPHYLFLTDEALVTHGAYAKCNPPLRGQRSVDRLWEHVQQGKVDVIGSDHAPFTMEEKQSENIWLPPAGFPGLEVLLPLMLTAVSQGKLSPADLVKLTSENAARIFGLSGKGRLAPGFDADIVIVDPDRRWVFDVNESLSKAGRLMRVYDGYELQGKPVTTFVRGQRVYDQGEILAEPGYGQFVRPDTAVRV